MLAIVLATASCLSPAGILNANRAATVAGPAPIGTLSTRYSYTGQHLTGEVSKKVDLSSGIFIVSEVIGPTEEARGFDGHLPWMKDASAFYLPEAGGDEIPLAISETYRNANEWWRANRGGAELDSIGCDGLRVTPRGGESFEAWFDPVTHLLIRTREQRSFGSFVDIRYSAFELRGNERVATRIDIDTNNDPTEMATLRLTHFAVSPTEAEASFAMPKSKPHDWKLPSDKVTVPFRLLNNHIIVDARVNGHGPFPFLVDTGGHDIVTPSTAAALGLRQVGESAATGAGEKTATSGYASVERLQVGDASLSYQTVIELDFSPIDVEGLQLGGMIGVEFFELFVVQIDYGARTLTLFDPSHFSGTDRVHAGTPISFHFYSHMPEVVGSLDGRKGLFNIDTGSRDELTLTAPFVKKAKLRQVYLDGITITDGWGVGGPSRSYVVRAGELDLGNVKVAHPVVGLSSAVHGAFSDGSYQGNVGSGLLKRFVATFDYPDQALYLRRAHYQDPDIGTFDKVGLWLNRADGGFKIMDVAAGGPAATSGLRVGDPVTAIHGSTVLADTLSDVRRALKLVPVGRQLIITIKRDGASRSVTVVPRNLIPK